MAVFRVEKTKDFTIMSNHHLRNTELSLKAKGLLSLMLSLPEDWDYTTKGLAHICKDGVDSITTALKELERHGYLTRQRLRYDNGQLGDIEYTIHEQPVSTENTGLSPKRENPRQVKPEQAKPKQAEPEQANPVQLNTNPLKTKKSKKDKSITYPSIYPAEPEAASRTDGMDRIELIEAYPGKTGGHRSDGFYQDKAPTGVHDMNSRRYWKSRLPFLLTNLVCMAALTVFLLVCGNSVSAVVLILIVWALILLTGLVLTYWKRKRQMKKLLDMAEQLSERYLISEVMELPEQAEDQVYYQLLKMAGKSMLEQIGEVERERLEYKEYIEQWIHEIKTPITAMKLLCENHRMNWTKELLLELEKTNRFTEQALYYARSEHTEKDYSVREMALSQVVHQAITDNKYLLLQSGMRLEVEEMQDTVYSDEKWVRFILNQLIANAVKYRMEQPVLRISTHKRQDQVVLVVEDNGIGIAASDLPRIFEKGFTGQNGRMVQQSTGIGLYLCKRLCEKLGIGIMAESSEHGTAISLSFHINCLIHEVQS